MRGVVWMKALLFLKDLCPENGFSKTSDLHSGIVQC